VLITVRFNIKIRSPSLDCDNCEIGSWGGN